MEIYLSIINFFVLFIAQPLREVVRLDPQNIMGSRFNLFK